MRNFNDFDLVKGRIAEEATTFQWCFLIQLRTGEQFFYTDGAQSVTVEGVLYRADPGITVTAIRDTDNAATQTATIDIGYSADMITEEIVRKGGLDKATFNLGLCDYRDRSIPFIEVFSGRVDRVTASNPYSCSVDLTGWQQKTVQLPGVYSLKCRNVFCDQGCTLNIEDYSYPFVMTGQPGLASTDGMTFGIGIDLKPGLLAYGSCKWTKGRNAGVVSAVAWNDTSTASTDKGQVKLMAPAPYLPIVGDEGILTAGCDFYADTCEKTYNNLIHMKAEPAVPQGTDTSIDVAKATSTQDPFKPTPAPEPVYTAGSNFPPFAK